MHNIFQLNDLIGSAKAILYWHDGDHVALEAGWKRSLICFIKTIKVITCPRLESSTVGSYELTAHGW